MSLKYILLYILGLTVLVGGLVMIGRGSAADTAKPSEVAAGTGPVASVAESSYDFGTMTTSDIKNAEFTVENKGTEKLELHHVSTSCDCTYAYVTTRAGKSEKFTMHGASDWVGTVEPGESAIVEVVYEPAIMPVRGKVERVVSIATNDPKRPSLTFKVSANVNK